MAKKATSKKITRKKTATRRAELPPQEVCVSPVDGIKRTIENEKRINEAFAVLFTDEAVPRLVKNYLRKLTIESVNGPGVDPNALLHLEGARWLVGVIETRVQLGREGK